MAPQEYDETAEALAIPNKDIADIRTDIAVITTTVEQLQHRLHLLMTVVLMVLGGVLATLWVLAPALGPGRD